VDDVKRLLEQFADRAVDGLPPADVDADVARGRRALRRIRARRRVTGVLCVAAATTAVLVVGDQAKWWGGGGTEVATEPAAPETSSAAPSEAKPVQTEQTVSTYGAAVVRLVVNKQSWPGIGCGLAPQGWTAQSAGGRVVLSPPSVRTSDTQASDQLELFGADQPESLSNLRAVETGGKVFHIGSSGGREIGQVKLGERWLVAKLPVGHQGWTDELLRRFLDSCTLS
jgi:hypothetical protein